MGPRRFHVLCPFSLTLACQNRKEGSEVSVMEREKGNSKGERRAGAGDCKGKGDSAEMRGCEGRHAVALRALIAAVLAVCALPLAAQMSGKQHTGQSRLRSAAKLIVHGNGDIRSCTS